MDTQKEWFEDWFDSPYYHILYGNRDMSEAEFFLNNLLKRYSPNNDWKIVDLACGKGRHSIYLNSLGFDVVGVDLSPQSIQEAKAFENERLKFEVGDLRQLNLSSPFDIALNLFTSFAYFDSLETDALVLQQIKNCLKPNGYLLIDFFNANKVGCALVPHEVKEKQGILFDIRKRVEEGIIIKDIQFSDAGKNYHYQEKVQALQLAHFEQLFQETGFELVDVFGAYDLSGFDANQSDRLILIAKNHA